ncbi:MAG: rhamnan synthesis F family protein [Spirochaetaceae bacterium]|jgi:rhamnosyltransferase|nr:rhamnan synthesis F family protein [Spirochaetaceae bacterium]
MDNPNTSLFISDKILHIDNKKNMDLYSVALHIHVYYLDVFEKYLTYFDSMPFAFDVFITTDTQEKKKIIQESLQSHKTAEYVKEIIIVKNIGRDVLPWISIAERLKTYNVAGHFHTKKTTTAEQWVGESWQKDIFETLLENSQSILNAFAQNPGLGVVIPDIPHYWRLHPLAYTHDADFLKKIKNLWQRMGCKKQLDFDAMTGFIMPFGTMFWYRPAALEKLTSLRFSAEEIPQEPLPVHGTILHAIERLIVYAAWDGDYDYRIAPLKTQMCGFADAMVWNRVIRSVYESRDYRAGHVLLAPLRFIKKMLTGAGRMCHQIKSKTPSP